MKKLLSLTAAFLSLFLLASCTQMETDNSSVPSLPGSSESSQSQSKEDPDSLEIKLTPELIEQNRQNNFNGGKFAEDERSIYYVHPTDQCLYRYDKDTKKQKILYDLNLEPEKYAYIQRIQLHNDRIYFLDMPPSQFESRQYSLYSVDRNGENFSKLLDVSTIDYINGYIVTDKYIYYLGYYAEKKITTLYQYDLSTGTSRRLLDTPCPDIQLGNRSIYFSGDEGRFYEYNLDTKKISAIDLSGYPLELRQHRFHYYWNERLYFIGYVDSEVTFQTFGYYDLKTKQCVNITTNQELMEAGAVDDEISGYYILGKDHYYVETFGPGYPCHPSISEIKNGTIISVETRKDIDFVNYTHFLVDGRKVCSNWQNKIYGYNELTNSIKN